MSGDFEKNISHRVNGFHISPGPQIWERVAAALPEKRRRRFAIWWWLPLAACLGGGIWLMINGGKNIADTNQTITQHKIADSNSSKQSAMLIPADTITSDIVKKRAGEKEHVNNKKTLVKKDQTEFKENEIVKRNRAGKKQVLSRTADETTIEDTEIAETDGTLHKRHAELAKGGTADVATFSINAAGNVQSHKATISDSGLFKAALVLPEINLAVIPSPEIVAKNDTVLPKNSDTLLRTSVETKRPESKNKERRPGWSLMVAVGKSSLGNNKSDILKSFDFANPFNLGGLTSGGQANNNGVFSNPVGGFNFNAGIMRNQTINKHMSWQAELSYQLLTAKQRIGNRNDSLVQFDVFTNTAFYTAGRAGNAMGTIRLNQVHRLQIAPGIRYTINPSANSPVSFNVGVSAAYTISNNLLLHDYRSYSYIRSAKLSNKLMLGSQAGFNVFINHTIYAGLFYQHDFTNVARSETGSVFRWNQVQLRMGIPLSKHK